MIAEPVADSHLSRLRMAELGAVRELFPVRARVLEIGGGSGFQAAVLASWGCVVSSVDIDTVGNWTARYFPVLAYDGVHLPFDDDEFDVVYSSNVLEHVRDLPMLLAEMQRILRPGGIALHLVPTPAWRAWSNVTHYPFLLRRLVCGRPAAVGTREPTLSNIVNRRGWWGMLWRIVYPPAHGELGGNLQELWRFRSAAWQCLFEAHGFVVERSFPAGVFYTGYSLLPRLSLRTRSRLARVFGSGSRAFVLRATASALG